MAYVVNEGLVAELDRWIAQGIELRRKLAKATNAPANRFATLREAVDALLLELDEFTVQELRDRLLTVYPSIGTGSSLNTALRKAVIKGKVHSPVNHIYKVRMEWKRTQIPDE